MLLKFLKPIVMELGMGIISPQRISSVYFINPSIGNTNITVIQISEANLNVA
jgi:hypothetical protein